MTGIPTLEDLEQELGGLGGKRILVRTDFNVPLDGNTIVDDFRIRAALPTINWLTERSAVVVTASHLGRPKGTPTPKYSMEPVRRRLAELAPGVELLENLRFDGGEEANDAAFVKQLIEGIDGYVNDAFGASHRAHASIVGPPRFLPSAMGRLLQREVEVLLALRESPKRPFVAVLGGAKVSDKLGVIEALLDTVDSLVIGGAMCFTFFAAQGRSIGDSLFEPDQVETCKRLLTTSKDLHLPTDIIGLDAAATSPRGAPVCPTAARVWTSDRVRRRPSPTSSPRRERCSGTGRWGCSRTSDSPPGHGRSLRRWRPPRRLPSLVGATRRRRSPSSASTTMSTTCRQEAAPRSSCSSSATCLGSPPSDRDGR